MKNYYKIELIDASNSNELTYRLTFNGNNIDWTGLATTKIR